MRLPHDASLLKTRLRTKHNTKHTIVCAGRVCTISIYDNINSVSMYHANDASVTNAILIHAITICTILLCCWQLRLTYWHGTVV